MKVSQMPPVHAANLVANSGNTAFGVIVMTCMKVQWNKTYGDQIVTQYQSRIFNKEHSLNNALKLFLNEPIGACGLILCNARFNFPHVYPSDNAEI